MKKLIIYSLYIFSSYMCGFSQETKDTDKKPDVEAVLFSVSSGVWMPTGKLEKLGVHPMAGFNMDIQYGKMYYGMGVDFRFLRARNDYSFYYSYTDTTIETNYHRGLRGGIHLGRELFVKNNYCLSANVGIACDFIKAVDEPDDRQIHSRKSKEDMAKYMFSYNIGLGLTNRYSFKNKTFVELGMCYQIVDYTLKNKSDLTGNALVVKLAFGIDVDD